MTFERLNDFAYWYKKSEEDNYVLVVSLGLIDEDTGNNDTRMSITVNSTSKPCIKNEESFRDSIIQASCEYLGLGVDEISIMSLEDSLEIMMQDGYESIEELAEEDVALLQLFGKALPFEASNSI